MRRPYHRAKPVPNEKKKEAALQAAQMRRAEEMEELEEMRFRSERDMC